MVGKEATESAFHLPQRYFRFISIEFAVRIGFYMLAFCTEKKYHGNEMGDAPN